MLASDWSSDVITGSGMGKPLTSKKKVSWAQGTESHVIWDGKPLTSRKKGSWAQETGSHVIWSGKPLTSREKRIVGSDEEKRGHVMTRTWRALWLGWETADPW